MLAKLSRTGFVLLPGRVGVGSKSVYQRGELLLSKNIVQEFKKSKTKETEGKSSEGLDQRERKMK